MLKFLQLVALTPVFFSLHPIHAAPVNFETEVLPFLEKKCVECHRAPYEKDGKTVKPKAGLRMDAAWAIKAGSEDGAILTAGKSGESSMFVRVTLPEDDDDFMPPVGKADPLSPEEVALLKRWIDEGADFGSWKGNLEGMPEESAPAPTEAPLSQSQQLYERLAEGLTATDEKLWESVTTTGGRVQRLSQTSPLLSVDFRLSSGEAGDEAVLSARALAPNIAHLDLSKTKATDAALSLLADTPNLVRLDLSNTTIGDEGLKHLEGLKELRYLNLHATAVTDAGLDHLRGLTSLDSVYLWQSKVTEKGAERLRAALPDAKINSK